jgi:hypothetical protein
MVVFPGAVFPQGYQENPRKEIGGTKRKLPETCIWQFQRLMTMADTPGNAKTLMAGGRSGNGVDWLQ